MSNTDDRQILVTKSMHPGVTRLVKIPAVKWDVAYDGWVDCVLWKVK